MRARRRLMLLTLPALLLVGGCGTPPWQEDRPDATPAPAATASGSPGPTPTPTPSASPARNDLTKGSLKRTLTAGGVQLTATYYSTLNLAEWTPAASKPLTVSVVGEFTDGSPQAIYLGRVTVTTDVAGPDGALKAPAPLVDNAAVKPGYVITAPTSYGQVFTVAALDPAATSVTLNLTYEVLAQVAPKSKQYAKQGASDTIVVPLAV